MKKSLTGILVLLQATSVAAEATRGPGTIEGTIGDAAIKIQGTCSKAEASFEFWSDGTQFAVHNDDNGDGMYLNIQVLTLGNQTVAAMHYYRNGNKVYAGTLKYLDFDGHSLQVNAQQGRHELPTTFSVQCD